MKSIDLTPFYCAYFTNQMQLLHSHSKLDVLILTCVQECNRGPEARQAGREGMASFKIDTTERQSVSVQNGGASS